MQVVEGPIIVTNATHDFETIHVPTQPFLGITAEITGTGIAGTCQLEASADNIIWGPVANSSLPISASGPQMWNYNGYGYLYIRVSVTSTNTNPMTVVVTLDGK